MSITTPTTAQVEAAQLKARLLQAQNQIATQVLPFARASLAKPDVVTALGSDAAGLQAIVAALETVAP